MWDNTRINPRLPSIKSNIYVKQISIGISAGMTDVVSGTITVVVGGQLGNIIKRGKKE